jgi:hypothetical protein
MSAVELQGLSVFISYPRGGHAHTWAERVQADLQARGASAWRDEHQVQEGDPSWYDRIRDALVAADAVVCIVDGHSEDCRWQKREALKADQLALPIVAFRTEAIGLPFYLAEQQPVELRDPPDGRHALATLSGALLRLRARPCAPAVTPALPDGADPAARRRETDWLHGLLHGELSDREERYVELAADLRQGREAERSLKGLRMPTSMVLKAFGMQAAEALHDEAEHLDDVLDALRRLSQRPAAVRRLAVLGEPGAGKSFSLERIACEAARRALRDPAAPLPLLVRLGAWTREQPLHDFIAQQIAPLAGEDFARLRDAGRALLLLDAVNEIPPGQRLAKAKQIRQMAEDTRFAAVVISCRERDFDADFHFPFDRLTLQPLTPWQIHGFLQRALGVGAGDPTTARQRAEACFWQIAGQNLRWAWDRWQEKGETLERFLTLRAVPDGRHILDWNSRALLADRRGLLKLAANPFLLTLMMQLVLETGMVPPNRARLIDGFLSLLHQREAEARQRRHDTASIPNLARWRAALVRLAEALQRLDGASGDDGARTSMPLRERPAEIDDALLAFSVDASVLQCQGDALRFTHQLLQESLAADALLGAARSGARPVQDFWPSDRWWQRSGWEVVAEIAAEACEGDASGQMALVRWLAEAQPGVAVDVWRHIGRPALSPPLLAATKARWLPRLTDLKAEPAAQARHAIGRWLGALDLDDRPGTGLRADGLPDIAWVPVDDQQPFVYQHAEHPPLPAFEIARNPVTNRQWQAFIDDAGYTDNRWWGGLAKHPQPADPNWSEPTAPRESVSWFEAVAYARWLSHRLGADVRLPTEQQWERAARGVEGREWPWGGEWDAERANAQFHLGRTSLVGLFSNGATVPERAGREGIFDLAGNVWEWCLNEFDDPGRTGTAGSARRVVRGGSWDGSSDYCRASFRSRNSPVDRYDSLGFRLVVSCPIQSPEP